MADNVLGTLFGDIANAIRSKTGEPETAKMKPSEFPTKILGIEVGGGATVEDIIPEQELTFVYDESNGVYTLGGHNLFNITSIALGKEYKVVWGSDEYSCTAVEGLYLGQYPMIGIGNPYAIGGENNNMPFAIGYITIPDDGDSQYSCIIASLDGSASKRVRVYQEAGGGSCDAVVWFVTFIGADGTKLYRMPVLDGDDCKDPITHGDISTPTKESTAQYTYTYSGWSLTEGGDASDSALTNVAEDRAVYASFGESVREYTITFYDGEDVITEMQVPYGEVPMVTTPSKDGYAFTEWQPSLVAVTGDASYYAQWKTQEKLADYTWEQLDAMSVEEARSKFKLGDKKGVYSLVGFEQDELASGGKAKMSFLYFNSGKSQYAYPASPNSFNEYSHFSYLQSNLSTMYPYYSEISPFAKTVKKKGLTDKSTMTYGYKDYAFWLVSASELGYVPSDSVPDEGSAYEAFAAKSYSDTMEENVNGNSLNIYAQYALRTLVADGALIMQSNRKLGKITSATKSVYFAIGFCV